MKQTGLTLQERRLIALMRLWAVLFSLAGIGFALIPDEIINRLNSFGHYIINWPALPLPLPAEDFWRILAVALLVVLTYTSLAAQSDIRRNLSFVPLIIISKFVSTAGFTIAFLFAGRHFVYFTAAVVDGIIFLITWLYYHRTGVSRAL